MFREGDKHHPLDLVIGGGLLAVDGVLACIPPLPLLYCWCVLVCTFLIFCLPLHVGFVPAGLLQHLLLGPLVQSFLCLKVLVLASLPPPLQLPSPSYQSTHNHFLSLSSRVPRVLDLPNIVLHHYLNLFF